MRPIREVVIASGARTAIGDFGGSLKDVPASELGTITAKEAIKRAKLSPANIQEVIVGHCMMRTDEINIARVIGLKAGIPFTTPGVTIQRQCASSMQALIFAVQQIMCEENEVVLVGGVEAMSRIPYVLYDMRWGKRIRHAQATDALWEGLTDPVTNLIMGLTAENLAAKYNITREAQDELAYTSHTRAANATKTGRFKDEIVPVEIKQKGKVVIVDKDEHPREGISIEALAKLPPSFKPDGTVTAGNSSGINDGAAAAVVMWEGEAAKRGIKPLARILAHAVAAVEPELMGYGPVPAVKKALKRANLTMDDIELWEVNEAFAAQYLTVEKLLGLNRNIVNMNGSGVALGHPVGATGVRIVITLLNEMIKRDLTIGCATLCVGGGMGKAVIVERIK